jgi:Gpi18-like mannosyltransferase
LFVALLCVIAFLHRDRLTNEVVITIALLSVVALPFLLPKMHERYFYAADVLSITFAFFSPRFFFVAIVVQVSSLLSYAPYFLDHDRPPAYLAYVAVAILLLILVLAAKLAGSLYRDRVAPVPESVSPPP